MSEELLETLLDIRRTTEAEVLELQQRIEQWRRQHPDFEALRHVVPQELSQISQAYVAAQIATIDARSQYAPGHPALAAAMKREEELRERYQQALKRATEVNAVRAEYERLVNELSTKEEFARRLNERIKELEVVIDAR